MLTEPWPTWKRSFPEDRRLKEYLSDIDALIEWRDKNAKGKEIWVTEFGWNSSTKKPRKGRRLRKVDGNNDTQQAQ